MSPSPNRIFAIRPDAGWLSARRRLLRQLKAEVVRRMGPEAPDVKVYTRRYERELAKPYKVSSKAEMLGAIATADVVFGGDFHALGPAQRTHLKILRSLQVERPVVVALECFSIEAQKWLDRFIAGKIDSDRLRKKSGWDEDWGFPWENYRPIFELAKRKKWSLVALNTSGGEKKRTAKQLEAREKNAAKVIERTLQASPRSLVYVIFGDLHLAKAHLPRALRARRSKEAPELREVTIHLNSERIYLELAKKGIELGVDVVKFSPTQFCVLSSPPWVKWQSYLLFLDRTADAAADEGLDDGVADFDPTDQVARLASLAAHDLGVDIKIDDLGVYADDESIWRSAERAFRSSDDREIARHLLANGRSFFLPAIGVAYLSRTTVNNAASLAGEYLHARLSGRSRVLWSFPSDFKALVWTEAVAYFVSKLVNHKRQAETLIDLRAQLAATGAGDQLRETLRLVLDMSLSELVWIRARRRRRLRVRPRRRSSYVEASRILGGMLGERLYLAFRSRRMKREDLVSWMSRDPSSRNFADAYDDIVMRLSSFGESPALIDAIKPRRERL